MTFSSIANALHSIAALVWVGGMFFAHMVLRPAALPLDPPLRLGLWARVFARFFAFVWAAVAVLLATGFGVIFVDFGGFAATPVFVHLMMLSGLLMTAIFVYLFFVPYARFKAAMAVSDWAGAAGHQAVIRRIVAVNLVLGLVTSAIGASGRFLG